MIDYISFLETHVHKFDTEGYCDLCGFHKNELLINSGIYKQDTETLDDWNDYENDQIFK